MLALLLLIVSTHRVYIIVYRFYFHPLANFPGPRLAAVSTLYRAYYQCYKDGKLLHKTMQLHKVYGKVSFLFLLGGEGEAKGMYRACDAHFP